MCWHNWKIIYLRRSKQFLGRTVYDFVSGFRVCDKCQRVDEDLGPGVQWWNALDYRRSKVVMESFKVSEDGKMYVDDDGMKGD